MNPSRRDIALGLAGLSAAALTPSPGLALDRAVRFQPPSLTEAAEAARRRFDLPGLAVLCARNGEMGEEIAVGIRTRGDATPVAAGDLWHIGSCAKAITATLIARLIEQGRLDWNTPVSEALSPLAGRMHPVSGRITVYQLLTMMSGLPENPTQVAGGGDLSFLSGTSGVVRQLRAVETLAADDPARRRLIAESVLSRAPPSEPGSRFGYSNTNYILLGAIAEEIGGQTFEALMAQEVFVPLGIRAFGYGAPGHDDRIDQPRGHQARRAGPAVSPGDPASDLPSFMRPAGGIHLGLSDWRLFVQDHLAGERDQGRLLGRDTYVRLHTVAPGNTQPYACGWGAVTHGERRMLTHTGNNTLWTATLRAYPETGHVFLYASNDGRVSEATRAFDQVRATVETLYPNF